MSDYFVIDGRDGDVTVHKYTKKEFTQVLNDGEAYDGVEFVELGSADSIASPWQMVSHFGENAVLVIRGTEVVPKPKEAVVTWEVD